MATLSLYLLGPTRVKLDEAYIEVKPRKALALMIYLAVTAERHSRDALATLLWPNSNQRRARHALRSRLSELNRTLGGDWIEADWESIGLRAGFWLDVAEFQQYLADETVKLQGLAAAAQLYRDDFLTGFTLPDCPGFDEWQFFQAERLRQALASALNRLVKNLIGQANYEAAIPHARRWLALDPLHEPVHRQLMRLYAQAGQQAAALRQYDLCRQTLADELGISPVPETNALYEQIRDRKDGPAKLDLMTEPDSVLPPFLSAGPVPSSAPTLFVARERELSQLETFLSDAVDSRGRVVFIKGEAGQGKTSLLNEFAHQAQVAHLDLIVSRGVCNVYTGVGDPYLPFREIIKLLTGDLEAPWTAGVVTRDQVLRLWNLLPQTVQALLDHGPHLIDTFVSKAALVRRAKAFTPGQTDWLMRLQALGSEEAPLDERSGPDQNRLFEAYTTVLQSLAGQKPLLILLDDLHWADLSSISLLFHLGRQITTSRILIVGAYRPEDLVRNRGDGPHPLAEVLAEFKRLFGDVWVDLGQAALVADRHFVDALLDAEPNRLNEPFRQALAYHTGGHPLFTTELLSDLKERGDLRQDERGRWIEGQNLSWDMLPARIEGVIEKRIKRLEPQLRRILAVASVEGEEFTAEVVALVQERREQALISQLSGQLDRQHRLIKDQGLVRLSTRRLSRYLFRHNLFQKYLYSGLGEAERASLHEAVGNALEQLYMDEREGIAIQLAHHFYEAGVVEKAVASLLLAGQHAVRLAANEEAITHLHKGLALLKTLPTTSQTLQQELTLLLTLGVPLSATKGYGSLDVEEVYRQARTLGQQTGKVSQLFPALFGLWRGYLIQGRLQKALDLAEQILQLAQTTQDPAHLVEAHRVSGVTLFHLGQLVAGQEHLEDCMALYDVRQHHSHAFLYGHDPGVTSYTYAAINLWLLGYPDQSLRCSREIRQLVQDALSHPLSRAYTLAFGAWPYMFRGETQVALEQTEIGVALAAKEGFPMFLAVGTIIRGWALAEAGQSETGLDQIRHGLEAWRTTDAGVFRPQYLAMLVEAYRKTGQIEAALTTLAEALALAKETGEGWWDAELYRLKGELLRQKSLPDGEVEACFRQAIDLARRQQAKSLELRAVMSLGRLWQRQGKREASRQMLADIYNWFTEGFDTADLQAARSMLDELS